MGLRTAGFLPDLPTEPGILTRCASPHAAVALVAALALGPSLGRGGQALLGVLLLLYLQVT